MTRLLTRALQQPHFSYTLLLAVAHLHNPGRHVLERTVVASAVQQEERAHLSMHVSSGRQQLLQSSPALCDAQQPACYPISVRCRDKLLSVVL